ncbi:MAG TPA: hypothetical protein VFT90_08820 [Chryseosolibacter sp.]|nr:hypothetical protein [Chryseosolibacter sp.]
MKKILISLLILAIVGVGVYAVYRALMPSIIAEATVSESLPDYIPKRLKTRVEAIRNPINKGAEAMIHKMHASEIPLNEVLDAIDNITEEQAYAFLDEVNATKPASTDAVFDLLKKHFPTEFDTEVFREPFNQHFRMKQVRNALAYANMNRKSNDVELATAKAILKKLIIEKEKEMAGR